MYLCCLCWRQGICGAQSRRGNVSTLHVSEYLLGQWNPYKQNRSDFRADLLERFWPKSTSIRVWFWTKYEKEPKPFDHFRIHKSQPYIQNGLKWRQWNIWLNACSLRAKGTFFKIPALLSSVVGIEYQDRVRIPGGWTESEISLDALFLVIFRRLQ